MNINHFDPRVSYPAKISRLNQNIRELEEACYILETLPIKMVQGFWRTIASKDLPQKVDKNKPINKGPYKQCLRKTLQAFLVSLI
jgi:hypothetical protein